MADREDAIEVEVIAIDGQAPPNREALPPSGEGRTMDAGWQAWQRQFGGRIRALDTRWWPLWILLGILAGAVVLTLGVVLGVLYLIFRIVRAVLVALLAPLLPPSGNTSIR